MCELLGISVDPAATMGLYLSAFRRRATENDSGWGVAWYEGGRSRVVKEPHRADHSAQADALAHRPPTSSLFLVHVRAATVGPVALHNTHPFAASLFGRDWVFAHNGTIHRLDGLPTGGRSPLGQTDSEIAFHHVLHCLEGLGPQPEEQDVETVVRDAARELSRRGKANFLLSDGEALFAHYDGHKTLHYATRHDGNLGTVRVADDDYTIDLHLPEVATSERAVIVASVPLSDEPWVALEPGSFLVCRDGRVTIGP